MAMHNGSGNEVAARLRTDRACDRAPVRARDRRGRAQPAKYPDHPVKVVVGFSAGGGTDVVARIIAQKMSETLGQTVVVENRTGASGMIAGEMVAKSPPDGYTLMMGTQTTFAVAPALYRKTTLDPARDFTGHRDERRLAAGAGGSPIGAGAFGART